MEAKYLFSSEIDQDSSNLQNQTDVVWYVHNRVDQFALIVLFLIKRNFPTLRANSTANFAILSVRYWIKLRYLQWTFADNLTINKRISVDANLNTS